MNTELIEQLAQQEHDRQQKFHQRIFCCTSTACLSAGAGLTHQMLERSVVSCDEHEVEVVKTGCMGVM